MPMPGKKFQSPAETPDPRTASKSGKRASKRSKFESPAAKTSGSEAKGHLRG